MGRIRAAKRLFADATIPAWGSEVDLPECHVHSLIADVAVLTDDRVLLVKYTDVNRYDHQEGWFLPDDGLRHLEHPEAGARRILNEQLGLTVRRPALGNIESFRGNDGSWHLAFHHSVAFEKAPPIQPSEDLLAAEWFDLGKLPPKSEVAHHGWALSVIRNLMAKSRRAVALGNKVS